MNDRSRLYGAGLLLCLVSAAASAQESEPAPAATPLEEVTVSARFIDEGGQSALKMDVPIKDVPFSLVSYSNAFMDTVDSTRLTDLFGYMSGVQKAGNSGYDLSIRGFTMGGGDRNAIMVDGLPGLSARVSSPSTVNLERVEVLKGPASVLYGRAQPGGFINLITKKPEAQSKALVDLRTSTFGGSGRSFGDAMGYIAALDSTGPVDSDGTFLYRAIFEYQNRDSFRDFVNQESIAVTPSLTWNVADATSATLMLEYRHSEQGYDQGLVAPNLEASRIAPVTTHYQEPGDTQEETGKTATLSVHHEFSDTLKWNTSARTVFVSDRSIGFENQAIRPNQILLQRRDRDQDNKREYHSLDTSLSAEFGTGPLAHKFLGGFTFSRAVEDFDRIRFLSGPPSIDIEIIDPIYGDPAPTAAQPPQAHSLSDADAYGVYVTDLITLSERWKAVVGLRYEKEKQSSEELRLPNVPRVEDTYADTLPMVGVLFQPTSEWTIYTSYSTSYVPPSPGAMAADPNTRLDAQWADQIEVGTKFDSAEGWGTVTLALFDIKKENVLQLLGTTGLFDQVGTETAQGGELELNLRPTEHIQFTAGYSYVDAKITDDVIANRVGALTQNAPKHSASILSRFDFSGALANFGASLGVIYRDERSGSLPSATEPRVLILPAYTVVDAGLYYTGDRFDASLKLSNVLDEEYYQSAFTAIRIGAGEPRQVALTARKHF